jgi:hypothetical protein
LAQVKGTTRKTHGRDFYLSADYAANEHGGTHLDGPVDSIIAERISRFGFRVLEK